jgi:serine phosphatase RsbU (regulator of sigma subunit)/Tfp pilus assembly protein PilF
MGCLFGHETSPPDTTDYIKIGKKHLSQNPDSALFYFKKAKVQSLKNNDSHDKYKALYALGVYHYYTNRYDSAEIYFRSSLREISYKDSSFDLANTFNAMGEIKRHLSQYDSSEAFFIKSIAKYKVSKGLTDAKTYIGKYASVLQNYGALKVKQSKYKEAMTYFLQVAELYKKEGYDKDLAVIYKNIAVVLGYAEDFKTAAGWHQKSIEILRDLKDSTSLSEALNSYALCLLYMKNFKEAEQLLNEGVKICLMRKDEANLYYLYNTLGMYYGDINDLQRSYEYYKKALDLEQEEEKNEYIIMANVGNTLYKLKRYNEALPYLTKALKGVRDAQATDIESNTLKTLAFLYRDIKDYKLSADYFSDYVTINDSVIQLTRTEEIADLEKKYQTEKKEQENKLLQAQNKIAEDTIGQQRLISYFSILGLILLAMVVVFILRSYRIKKRANIALSDKNILIQKQKELVEEHQKEILDSITYAKRLQQAILPPLSYLDQHLSDYFILYKPKDIVAGDFYWAEEKNGLLYIAAADCTGHGVPGAMVSVVCSNALNRTIKEFNLSDPGKILDKVRELVLETFARSESEVKDGMDISLCSINTVTREILWSGANNPLWYTQGDQLFELKADKQPIGKNDRPKPFTTHSLHLHPNDMVYLFTDGYPDQFGGPKGKKFKYKQLEELILKNTSLHPEKQKLELENVFEKWKGELEQVDDVCVIGIRL